MNAGTGHGGTSGGHPAGVRQTTAGLPPIIAGTAAGFAFTLANGMPLPDGPPLPGGSAEGLAAAHGAQIAYHTIVPPHSGERLDLHAAIWICFHNAKVRAAQRELAAAA